jgi:hypothetical protein
VSLFAEALPSSENPFGSLQIVRASPTNGERYP